MRFVIAGGGTGGHLFPGLAIAEEIKRRLPQARVLFVGTKGGIENQVLPRDELRIISSAGLGRRLSWRTVNGIWSAFKGVIQSLILLRRFRPKGVIGTGGYVSGPVVLAALLLRVPSMLHEQNSYPGVTTRLLSRLVATVHLAFDEARPLVRGRNVVVSGTPTRREVTSWSRKAAISHLKLDPAKRTILILGGSQGAHSINRALAEGLGKLAGETVQLIWQTGRKDYQRTVETMERQGLRGVARAFFNDVGALYAAADLVVCRAGATTIAEITARGIAAILIPYPHATAGHQLRNAQILARGGAAEVVRDEELPRGILVERIVGLLKNGEKREIMAWSSRAMGHTEAARRIVEDLVSLCSGKRDSFT